MFRNGSSDRDNVGGDYFPLQDFGSSSNNSEDNIIDAYPMTDSVIRTTKPSLDHDQQELLENQNQAIPSVHNLDDFLTEVYEYFQGKGFMCMFFNELFELFTSLFVVSFFTFLVSFVKYDVLFSNPSSLSNSVDFNQDIPLGVLIFLVLFGIYWTGKFLRFMASIKSHIEIKSFYYHTLKISEDDLQTIEWREVVNRLVKVPRLCIVKENMNALDVANRIMRKENYVIGIINRNILDLTIPFPFLHKYKFITKTLEWSLMYALFNYIFDANGEVKQEVLDRSQRQKLARGLSRRFRTVGLIGLFAAPFVFIFLLINFFFEYAEEFKSKPGSLGSREWSPLAKWKFREFNELPHYFKNRLNLSYSHANKYVDSFPSEILSIFAKFISFIIGSVLAVFLIFGIISDDFLFSFDIFGRTPIWYVGILGTAIAICKSLIVDDNNVSRPALQMTRVVQYTRYCPKSWRGKSHTHAVRDEFLTLFEFRVVNFFREIASVIFAPFILMFSLPNSSLEIIDFFGSFTYRVNGVGLICSFGAFTDIKKHGSKKYGANQDSDKFYRTKQGKLEKSIVNFSLVHPDWKPNNNEILNNLNNYVQQQQQQRNGGNEASTEAPNWSLNDLEHMQDSNYVAPSIVQMVLGSGSEGSGSSNQPQQQRVPRIRVDQNVINAVNDLQQSYYQSQIFENQNQV